MENEVVSPFSIRMCTYNYVNLLAKCFLKQHPVSLMRVIKWNDKGGNDMIFDGSSLAISVSPVLGAFLGMGMVLGSMDLLKI
ncbi:hypothetical protein MtrunA17_Chr1g0177371 [Medicago truncatula]|uniref:Transmembrane protein, putative n=1 Tax=Medicago truncatula TaxID=3880 RepID=A0A072VIR8_MEDTR|nr:transmembrane protein, putative [Medicago truncatula]RHN79441.1 hypothetical protein MtrunA17_Chr1g0177371 [Medicago truncatula]